MPGEKLTSISVLAFVATGTLSLATPAQERGEEAGPQTAPQDEWMESLVVTGSRIRGPREDISAPLQTIEPELFPDRGFVSAAQAINNLTSAVPQLNLAEGDGTSSGSGQQFPNLFNLGPGRTLTLVNGRRTVTTSEGIDDSKVDANIIPVGLIEKIEVVQGGGAAVYGSDAIAGVVNYILRDDFEGAEIDVQGGDSSEGDYPVYNLRGTFGTHFDAGRGNVAINVEWSKDEPLAGADREASARSRVTQTNAQDTGPNDGIPAVREVLDATFWAHNANGIIFSAPAPLRDQLVTRDGVPLQFNSAGEVVAYNPGNILGIPFAEGGEGFRYSDLAGLTSGVERLVGNAIGHYDIDDRITLSSEFLYTRTDGVDVPQGQSRSVLSPFGSPLSAVTFTVDNPFLTSAAREALIAANPGFEFGAPMFLSKYFVDLVPNGEQNYENETLRALVALDGEFSALGRDMYWSVSTSFGHVEGETRNWQVLNAEYGNAINAALDGDGDIVCAINADDNEDNDDQSCAPINPFGAGNVSAAARDYVSVIGGSDYTNEQFDVVASLGGEAFPLPGGRLSFSVTYEHRREEAEFDPKAPNRQGLTGVGETVVPEDGSYDTDEFSGELLIPIAGGDFKLPGVDLLELSTAYRFVDNSLAGAENVWDFGLRWIPVHGVTVRATRSRNFRAPSLTQLLQPATSALEPIEADPCDADRIDRGPNPTVRRANCEAEFAANPEWGPLEDFQDLAENTSIATVTTEGNGELENEISDTFSYGLVFEPVSVPDLTLSVDRIEIDLEQGISAFTTELYAAECYDSVDQPEQFCSRFTRLAVAEGDIAGGTLITGTTSTVNAGVIEYRGEVYAFNYGLEPSRLLGQGGGDRYGYLSLGFSATHNSSLRTAVTGSNFVDTDGTIDLPSWVMRFDINYELGSLRMSYQANYLDEAKREPGANIENDPTPVVDSNTTHDISASYAFDSFILRAGINNLTDEEPSYPTTSYGDIIGRQYFLGLNIKL